MSGSQQLLLGTGVPAVAANYIEEVFSTWLYTGNNSTQTIINGIDLAGKGGMVWAKSRDQGSWPHIITGTNFASGYRSVSPNTTNAEQSLGDITSWNSNGFTMNVNSGYMNYSGPFVSWTFRKQPKFFDVVTYTGTGASNPVAHSLGSTPGCVIIKSTSASDNWTTLHRANGTWVNGALNTTFSLSPAGATATNAITSTTINVQSISNGIGENLNTLGRQYVMYLFAHNAGGFGLTGTDNVISCGAFTTDGSGLATVNLGYEPQWVLLKDTAGNGGWFLLDTMRGLSLTNNSDAILYANTSAAEILRNVLSPTATGFVADASSELYYNTTYIYIAIRRGPMKTPTSGASVFSPQYATFSGSTVTDTGFVVDLTISKSGVATGSSNWAIDRLRGAGNSVVSSQQATLQTNDTSAEIASSGRVALTGTVTIQNGFLQQTTTANSIVWAFRRAPGFFDEVCYTGNGSSPRAISHNLAVAPELIISKSRSTGAGWIVYAAPAGFSVGGVLNSATAFSSGVASVTATSASTYTTWENDSGVNFVAYLFASCPGVSKVGSYTGTGALQTVNCGFTGGARFVLIKRTDSTGDWWVYDSARGISSSNDPYLLMNNADAQVTGTNYVDTTSVGFQVTAAAPAGLNANGGTYIFLAVS